MTQAASKKKATKPPKRKAVPAKKKAVICKVKGCRKHARVKSGMCLVHAPESVALDENELLRFRALNSEMEVALLRLGDIPGRKKALQEEYAHKMGVIEAEEQALKVDVQQINGEHKPFVEALAKKYGVADAKHMVIDTKTGIVRDGSTT